MKPVPQSFFQFDAPYDPQAFVVAPSAYPQAQETSAIAAARNHPQRGNQNRVLMALLNAAGDVGLSDPEIQDRTGFSRQSICARRYDCRSQLRPAETRYAIGTQTYTRWRVK